MIEETTTRAAASEDPEAPDCMRCAACCFSSSPRHARVTGDDYERLGESAEAWVTWIGNEAFMRLDEVAIGLTKCAALGIDAASAGFACSIYETRPEVCRALARGGASCRGELATKAERPRRALRVLGVSPRRP